MVRVTVFERLRDPDDIPGDLLTFVEWINSKINLIPELYRDVAVIDIDTDDSYDSCSLQFKIYYDRPETQADIEQRKREAEEASLSNIAFLEKSERETYERLRKKFEGGA